MRRTGHQFERVIRDGTIFPDMTRGEVTVLRCALGAAADSLTDPSGCSSISVQLRPSLS
jgi:hypothetical protein